MPACRSNSSQSRASTPSQNSMSPLNASEPLTPPEPLTLTQHPIPTTPGSQSYQQSYGTEQGMSRPPMPMPMPQSCSFDAFSAGSSGSGMGYSPSMLMPPPSSYPNGSYMPVPPGTSFSPLMSSPLRPHDSPYGGEHYGSSSQFGSYPQSYPYPQYSMGVPMTQTMSHQSTTTSYSGMNTDTDADEGFASMLNIDGEEEEYRQSSAEPSTGKSLKASTIPNVAQPPRPPNAWIMYRSDKLKEIRDGRQIEGFDKIMTESGLSSSASASSGEESLMNGEMGEKPKRRKGKKGVKEPTEGLLRMGKGKTGRGLPQAHISKMISELWKAETPAIRGEYERRSEVKKLEHAEKYPDYKFQPMRKADKTRAKEERDREKLALKREKEAKAIAARPRKNGSRSRPSTATSPYSVTPRTMARSISMTGIQHSSNMLQQAGNEPMLSPTSNYPAFPIPKQSLPSLQKNTMGPPRSTPDRSSSRHPSPTKTPSSRSSAQMDQSMPPPPLPHTPAPEVVYDPALEHQSNQYHQYQQPVQYHYQPIPQYQYPYDQGHRQDQNQNQGQDQNQAGPSHSQPEGPFYYDINGTGPAYALPVVYEPQGLPDGQSLDDLALDFTGSLEDLVEQWVTLEEDTTEGNEAEGGWTMQAPDLAVSSWDNLAPDAQEQIFADLDLSHTMAVHLTPDLANHEVYNMYSHDQTPLIDYSSGYMSYPIYDNPQESGPFLYMPQPTSPNPDATTPRQSTFNRNSSNVYQSQSEEERRVSTSNNGPTRYVSSSAFPETPLSVDPRGLGSNRQASYANAGLDEYDWADPLPDQDQDGEGEGEGEVEEEKPSQAKLLAIPPPLEMPLSPISPIDANIQVEATPPIVENTSPQKQGAGPPRGQRRARTVAGSFH